MGSDSASLGMRIEVRIALEEWVSLMNKSKTHGGPEGLDREFHPVSVRILLRVSACTASGWSLLFQSARM